MAGAHGWRDLAVVLALVQTANSFHAPIALRHRELQSPVFSSQVAAAASPPLRRRTPPGPRAAALPAAMPAALSLLPPVATLAASIALKQTILAMVFGVWTGALLLAGGNPIVATLRTFDGYVLSALAGKDHAGVVVFTTILGGTIGIVQKSGGALGLAGLVKGFFTSRRRGALSTMALGSLVFFDDYSSVLIVGNSLRPLLSAVRLSAAKFAYITHTIALVLGRYPNRVYCRRLRPAGQPTAGGRRDARPLRHLPHIAPAALLPVVHDHLRAPRRPHRPRFRADARGRARSTQAAERAGFVRGGQLGDGGVGGRARPRSRHATPRGQRPRAFWHRARRLLWRHGVPGALGDRGDARSSAPCGEHREQPTVRRLGERAHLGLDIRVARRHDSRALATAP